jgi:predicted O-methyltransferase YrrM
MDATLAGVARDAPGFMPDAEGRALYEVAVASARRGPLLEIGTYCGKSAVYLGAAARASGSTCFTIDHHRGSEEQQAGWPYHDGSLVDPRTGRIDTLPRFRRTIEQAGLEDVVVAIVGDSVRVASFWSTPLGMVFVDGAHAFDDVLADFRAWSPHVVTGGTLVFHDVFADPADGGQGPYEVWRIAVASGDFDPIAELGSLRVLRRVRAVRVGSGALRRGDAQGSRPHVDRDPGDGNQLEVEGITE